MSDEGGAKRSRLRRLTLEAVSQLLFLLAAAPAAAAQTPALRDLFRRVSPAVVVVAAEMKEPAPEARGGFVTLQGVGSGVVVSEAGQVVTAAHVVQAADKILVTISESVQVSARVVASSPIVDVALLQLDEVPPGLSVARLGDSDRVEVGDPVFVIGNPYGLGRTLTTGVLSARRTPRMVVEATARMEVFQTDAAVNQGNSGSPMFNMRGEVIGIVCAIVSRSGGFEGLGFATPSNIARRVLLEEKLSWSGIDGYLLDGDLAKALNLPQTAGLLVQRVARGSPAAQVGLVAGTMRAIVGDETLHLGGDVVLEVAGIAVADVASLERIGAAVSRLGPGDPVPVKILRAGKVLALTGRRPR